jgi:hypothetical protein
VRHERAAHHLVLEVDAVLLGAAHVGEEWTRFDP